MVVTLKGIMFRFPTSEEEERKTYARGKMTAQDVIGIFQAGGTAGLARTTMVAMTRKDAVRTNQYRFAIFGTSIQKFDRSTS